MATNDLRIGMIGLDTSHVVGFAKALNDPANADAFAGARITVGYPGGSNDFELSRSRVDGFTKQLREEHGVRIVDSPEAVAENCDLLFITSVDGRVHLDQFRRTVTSRRPTFIDKPFAVSSRDAVEIFRVADDAKVPVMSCSSLRYAETLTTALPKDGADAIAGCDVFGPMEIQPTQPGWFWYGIHSIETMQRIMGRGCREVRVVANENADVMTAVYGDGRVATARGIRKAHHAFGATIHRTKAFEFVDLMAGKKSWTVTLLEAILRSLPNGKSDVAKDDTLEVMRIIEAANESRETGKASRITHDSNEPRP
jgi:predicted dehydrogenase